MDLIWWTGAIVWVALALVVAALICHVVGNIYGGIKSFIHDMIDLRSVDWEELAQAHGG